MREGDKLIVLGLVLTFLGILAVYSVAPSLLVKQSSSVLVGIALGVIFSRVELSFWSGLRYYLVIGSILLLAITKLIGQFTRGSSRWISIFGLQFQSSEFVKIIMIMFVADFLSNNILTNNHNFEKIIICFLIPAWLVFIQPDLGTTIVLISILTSGMLLVKLPIKKILLIFLTGILLIPFMVRELKPYQLERIYNFINPDHDSSGTGYNLNQSIIAIGSGKLIGKGLGRGTQSQLKFLPEKHTDFIYATIVEEMGFIGGFVVIGLFTGMMFILYSAASKITFTQEKVILYASANLIGSQCLIHLGMNMGLLPITGITLPLVSYGGSSIACFWILLIMNAAIINRSKHQQVLGGNLKI